VQDGNYLSARWPGDVHLFAGTFAAMIANTRKKEAIENWRGRPLGAESPKTPVVASKLSQGRQDASTGGVIVLPVEAVPWRFFPYILIVMPRFSRGHGLVPVEIAEGAGISLEAGVSIRASKQTPAWSTWFQSAGKLREVCRCRGLNFQAARWWFWPTPRLCRKAAMAWVRRSQPSFSRMAETWLFTVPSVTPSSQAICLLSRPRVISSRIST
jgi:hypothetical protein